MTTEKERRNRIKVSVAAYAYEFESVSIMTDSQYDELARSIDPCVETGHEILDEFFRTDFTPFTGQWVHTHPERHKLREIYHQFHKVKRSYSYDQRHNVDLFGPEVVKPEPVKNPCKRCGKDVTKNPFDNGCYC